MQNSNWMLVIPPIILAILELLVAWAIYDFISFAIIIGGIVLVTMAAIGSYIIFD